MAKGNKKGRLLLACIAAVALVATELHISNNVIQVSAHTLSYTDLPPAFDGFKILQISDLHSKSFGEENQDLAAAIRREAPDIVVMTGDMADSQASLVVLMNLVERLDGIPIYYVAGNHEQSKAPAFRTQMKDELEAAGVTVLCDERVLLERDGETVALWGLEIPLYYYRRFTNPDHRDRELTADNIRSILGEPEEFNILLAHNPVYEDAYSEWGAHLTFSGHIHGGLVRVPFVGGVLSPEVELFPHYDSGVFTQGESRLVVSRGLGTGSAGGGKLGLRFFNRPELVVITLAVEE